MQRISNRRKQWMEGPICLISRFSLRKVVVPGPCNTAVPAAIPPAQIRHPVVTCAGFPSRKLREHGDKGVTREPQYNRNPDLGVPVEKGRGTLHFSGGFLQL